MTTPICTIDENGIFRPSLVDCLTYFQDQYRAIYGQDVYIESDSQDGELLGLFAQALHDVNGATVATYNSFSPSKAIGEALSSNVKIDGIRRKVASYSTAAVSIVGVIGTVITNGLVADDNGNLWALPASITIPSTGEIATTATAVEKGMIFAPRGTITTIAISQPGWQTVYNVSDAIPGAAIESDGELRQRQTYSASLPSVTTFDGLRAGIASLGGIVKSQVYENKMAAADSYGIPGHSVSVVTLGGIEAQIGEMIALKKGNGVGTYGLNYYDTLPDQYGLSQRIYYTQAQNVPITFSMTLTALAGFTSDVLEKIKSSLVDWVTSKPIGSTFQLSDALAIARLQGDADYASFNIDATTFKMARSGQAPTQTDVHLLYYENGLSDVSYVNINLLPVT